MSRMSARKSTCQLRNSVWDFFTKSKVGTAALPRGFGRPAGHSHSCWNFFNSTFPALNRLSRQGKAKAAQLSTGCGPIRNWLGTCGAACSGQTSANAPTRQHAIVQGSLLPNFNQFSGVTVLLGLSTFNRLTRRSTAKAAQLSTVGWLHPVSTRGGIVLRKNPQATIPPN